MKPTQRTSSIKAIQSSHFRHRSPRGWWAVFTAFAGLAVAAEPPSLVPKPAKIEMAEGHYSIDRATAIQVSPGTREVKGIGQYLADLLAPATGLKVPVKTPWFSRSSGIALSLDASRKELGDEGYALTCTVKGVRIVAARPAGLFYGIQSLRQLLPVEIESAQKVDGVTWTVPCVKIEDRPRFTWRGYLLDPARNFRTKEEIKRCIDLLALHKMNVLQLHLTDDQGWRVEIKAFPKLVETGSRLPDYAGRKGEGWFYSQDEVKELVAYAASRYVTMVPEIEMPGHSGAVLASYPELGCGGKHPGGWGAPLCVSREDTFAFAAQVLDEIIELFPSPFIHVGADEVPPGPWRACASCKAAMDKLAQTPLPDDVNSYHVKVDSGAGVPHHADISRLQGEFIRKIDHHLAAKGRRMVGWDEILDGGLKDGSSAVVMAWRGPSAVKGANEQKRDVIVTLYPLYYLDNDVPLQRTYEYEPVPADLPADAGTRVLGVQGNMWGETTSSLQKVDIRTFPRLCALAETGWTAGENKNFDDFSIRLNRLRQRLEWMGVDSKGFGNR